MILHTTNGTKQITQTDAEIDWVEDEDFGRHGLVKVAKTATSGTLEVVLAAETASRTYDLEKWDVNGAQLLITKIVSHTDIDATDIKVFV